MAKRGTSWLAALALVAMSAAAVAQSPSTVLVVANSANAQSVALADYYMSKRNIPSQNLLLLNWNAADNADTCSLAYFKASIATPIYSRIAQLPQIDYIVLCRNLPIKISDTSGSVDSALAGKCTSKRSNPYRCKGTAFAAQTYGVYLVTRLDGWSWDDAQALVDRSLAAVKCGSFLLDADPSKTAAGYAGFNVAIAYAGTFLKTLAKPYQLDQTNSFVSCAAPVAGYVSWGSNDSHYSAATFQAIRFTPGAIAETAVSTSGSNIRYPGGSQSQVAQLVRDGVTGVKGYVSEPYVDALANPIYLFYRYAGGRNLAEAYYSASAYMGWKDVVLGDPLCAPYK